MRPVNRLCGLALPAAVMSLVAIGIVATPARSAFSLKRAAVTSFAIPGALNGVAATSASNAWAVGASGTGPATKTLLLHWNGTRWSQVTNPKPALGGLSAVDAVSADNVWAVGYTSNAAVTAFKPLVMHWNGTKWSVQAGVPAIAGSLTAVAVRGNDVWAVGGTDGNPSGSPPLVLHRTGNRWYVVPTGVTGGNGYLSAIAVTGDRTAWAVGRYFTANGYQTFVMRWNGTRWRQVSFPLPAALTPLCGMAADSAGAMWAVGFYQSPTFGEGTSVSMRWDGKTWRKVPVGPFTSDSALYAVSFIPGGTAWAVGWDNIGSLILRWTGRAWSKAANLHDGSSSVGLVSVAASSASNAWAVGETDNSRATDPKTLIVHWNGKTWSQQ